MLKLFQPAAAAAATAPLAPATAPLAPALPIIQTISDNPLLVPAHAAAQPAIPLNEFALRFEFSDNICNTLQGEGFTSSNQLRLISLPPVAVTLMHEPWQISHQASCMSRVNIPGWDICHHTQSILWDDYYTCHCARRVPPWCPPSLGIIRQHRNLPHRRARRCPSYFLIWKALHFVCSTRSGTVHTSGPFPHFLPTVV